jgi:hypothetical protein
MQSDIDDAYHINFEDRDGYFYAFVFGDEDSLDISQEYWPRVINECFRREYDCLLVEEDFPNQLSPTELFILILAITELLTKPLKIAFVDRKSEHNDLNMFAETVAVNRGVFGRIFANVTDAEVWLKS